MFTASALPLGDDTQTPDEFVRQQSATTGLPEHMCRMNMEKLRYVLDHLDEILDALTRHLDRRILTGGFGEENGVMRSYQATTPVLGMVLPSNSPGCTACGCRSFRYRSGWCLKPGPQEPWTPWRMTQAFIQAACRSRPSPCIPDWATSVRPSEPLSAEPHLRGNEHGRGLQRKPAVQVHGPGFSKILLGDDKVDEWEQYLDLMVDSVLVNSGRSCINCSGIWAPRHTREIADALAARLGPIERCRQTTPRRLSPPSPFRVRLRRSPKTSMRRCKSQGWKR